jgi:hypothetical protein
MTATINYTDGRTLPAALPRCRAEAGAHEDNEAEDEGVIMRVRGWPGLGGGRKYR